MLIKIQRKKFKKISNNGKTFYKIKLKKIKMKFIKRKVKNQNQLNGKILILQKNPIKNLIKANKKLPSKKSRVHLQVQKLHYKQ